MSNKKAWQRNEIIELISMYKQRSVLWNTKDIEHRNREKKAKILHEIALEFSCSIEEIQRKIHNLRNQMSQELKKMKKKANSGTDDVISTCNWPYFQALQFLLPVLTHDNTQLPCIGASVFIKKNEEPDVSTINNEETNMPAINNEEPDVSAINSEKNVGGNDETNKPMQVQKKRKRLNDIEEQLYRSALKTLQQGSDDYDKFGEYVALELKSLRLDYNKARLKHEIRKAIVRIAEEDLYGSCPTSSISTPLPSPLTKEEYYQQFS